MRVKKYNQFILERFKKFEYFILNRTNPEYYITVKGDGSLLDIKNFLLKQENVLNIQEEKTPSNIDCISFEVKPNLEYLTITKIMEGFDKLGYKVVCREKVW